MLKNLALILTVFSNFCYAEADLSELQISSQSIGGVQFPRDMEYRFRGQEAELFGLNEALSAFYGDSTTFIETLEFSVISLILQDKFWYSPYEDDKIAIMRTSFCKNWADKSQTYNPRSKKCHQLETKKISSSETLGDAIERIKKSQPIFSFEQAQLIAKSLLDEQFAYESNQSKTQRLINYTSGRYEDFPSDVVFSTVYPQNAAIYGDSILVLNDQRSIDLSYYNGILNNQWGIWGDAGEFVTPGYIAADELAGIHLRKRYDYPDKLRNRVGIDQYGVQKHAPIEYAFYKTSFGGKTYVLAFDGKVKRRNSNCLKPDQNGTIVHCRWTRGTHNFNGQNVLIGNQKLAPNKNLVATLIGVLVLHPVDEEPEEISGLLDQFQFFSRRGLDQSLKNSQGIGEESPLSTISKFRKTINGTKYKLTLVGRKG